MNKIVSIFSKVSRQQWVMLLIWTILFIAFLAWVGNFWWLLLWPFIFDIYITKIIPWTWWKKYKKTNPIVYTIGSWIDAIVFCLVAVWLINTYFFQNYRIPSSSLEKTLLTGDFLLVSKIAYGPRNPMTPLSLPLAQNTIPILNCKSYFEKPQLAYKRLKGLGNVERGDIVVFNFPAGDSVTLKIQNPDFYSLCYHYGRETVMGNKSRFGKLIYRPVDKRENYIKRCVGLPGDTLRILSRDIYINGVRQETPAQVQFNYFVQTRGGDFDREELIAMGINIDDVLLTNPNREDMSILLDTLQIKGVDGRLPLYRMPLTKQEVEEIQNLPGINAVCMEPAWLAGEVWPLGHNVWTRDDFGPIYIPQKGTTIELTFENLPLYSHLITHYEKHTLSYDASDIYIDGEKTNQYTFEMNYYWMMGDNRHNSADSRYWGFVPEDHIVGCPVFIWLSIDKYKSFFNGKIRWNRFFKSAKN